MAGYITDWETDPDKLDSVHDLSKPRQGRTFTKSSSNMLEINLAKSYQTNILENDEQLVIPIFGQPGSGKSTLMLWIEYFFFGDINFDTTVFTHEDWKDEATKGSGKVIKYEEGRQTFVKRRAMSGNNKEGLDVLSIFRAKNHVHFINFQNISDVEDDLLFYHSDGVLWVHKMFDGEKGFVSAYSPKTLRKPKVKDKIKDMELKPYEHSDLTTQFPNFAERFPGKWAEYNERKHENLDKIRGRFVEEDDEDDEDDGSSERDRREELKGEEINNDE